LSCLCVQPSFTGNDWLVSSATLAKAVKWFLSVAALNPHCIQNMHHAESC